MVTIDSTVLVTLRLSGEVAVHRGAVAHSVGDEAVTHELPVDRGSDDARVDLVEPTLGGVGTAGISLL